PRPGARRWGEKTGGATRRRETAGTFPSRGRGRGVRRARARSRPSSRPARLRSRRRRKIRPWVHSKLRDDGTSPAVEFRDVSKSYAPGRSVLAGFSLTVHAGETVAMLGPSGCGKTTALKLVNRLLDPESGQVLVFGRDVRSEDAI